MQELVDAGVAGVVRSPVLVEPTRDHVQQDVLQNDDKQLP